MPRVLRELQTLEGHQDRVWCVAWSPSGATLASCGGDRTVRLWARTDSGGANGGDDSAGAAPAWACVATLEELHNRTIRTVAWSPCGRMLATASFDGTVGIWESGGGGEWDCIATLEGHENEVKAAAWSRCGNWLATCGRDKSVWVWEAQPGGDFECAAVLHGHAQDVKSVVWHPDGERLISCSYDDSIRVWAEEPGGDDWTCVQILPGAATAAKEAAAAARAAAKAAGAPSDPDALAAAAADAATAAVQRCGGHTSSVWGVACRPDGNAMASVSDDGSLRFWHAAHGAPMAFRGAVQEAHSRAVFAADWSPNAAHVATVGADNALRVWVPAAEAAGDAAAATLLAEAPQAHPADVNAVRWHPKRAGWLATGGDDGCVRIWALEDGDDVAMDADAAGAMTP